MLQEKRIQRGVNPEHHAAIMFRSISLFSQLEQVSSNRTIHTLY